MSFFLVQKKKEKIRKTRVVPDSLHKKQNKKEKEKRRKEKGRIF